MPNTPSPLVELEALRGELERLSAEIRRIELRAGPLPGKAKQLVALRAFRKLREDRYRMLQRQIGDLHI
jgi:hypothetical protein